METLPCLFGKEQCGRLSGMTSTRPTVDPVEGTYTHTHTHTQTLCGVASGAQCSVDVATSSCDVMLHDATRRDVIP